MKVGCLFPQGHMGPDRGQLRAFADGVQALGFSHLLAFDHVLGVEPSLRPEWSGPYEADDPFHEPLTLFSFCAGVAPDLGFATAVMVLPQRQTALVAKQAAEVDLLSGGEMRLGVGLGWNQPEYEGLGVPWEARGRRIEEQVKVLRHLWTLSAIEFKGQFHELIGTGINPRPGGTGIPIWLGGSSDRALKRAAEHGDGFFPMRPLPDRPLESEWPARIAQMREWREAAGRDPGDFGIEPRIDVTVGNPEIWRRAAEQWAEIGANHVSVSSMGLETGETAAHLDLLARAHAALADLSSNEVAA